MHVFFIKVSVLAALGNVPASGKGHCLLGMRPDVRKGLSQAGLSSRETGTRYFCAGTGIFMMSFQMTPSTSLSI